MRKSKMTNKKPRKIRLLEEFILQNSVLWLDGKGIYSKWDDQIDWLNGFPIDFKIYIRRLHKKIGK